MKTQSSFPECRQNRFTGGALTPGVIVPPAYGMSEASGKPAGVISYGVDRLGYEQGVVNAGTNSSNYTQKCWGNFSYSVDLRWTSGKKETTGRWNISSYSDEDEREKSSGNDREQSAVEKFSGDTSAPSAADYQAAYENHSSWWRDFWSASGLSLPDTLLERQWYKLLAGIRRQSYGPFCRVYKLDVGEA